MKLNILKFGLVSSIIGLITSIIFFILLNIKSGTGFFSIRYFMQKVEVGLVIFFICNIILFVYKIKRFDN
ncbi:MAG: hypothetical protein SOY42_07295 [Clostridium sp.]|nr:hypothetical protein [Clostridium sp.]